MLMVYILIGIVAIIINIYISVLFQEAAANKGFDEAKYFWICFFFGLVGYLFVIALPNLCYSQSSSTFNASQPTPLSKQTAAQTSEKTCINCGKKQSILNEICIECGGKI